MTGMASEDPFVELKSSYKDYKVFDGHYERIGKVDEIFVDEVDHPLYLGVSTGGILDSGSVLVPMDLVRINDKRQVIEVAAPRERIEEAPTLGSGDELSPDTEDRVRTFYGLDPLYSPARPPGEDLDARSADEGLAFDERVDLVPGEREASQPPLEGVPPRRERRTAEEEAALSGREESAKDREPRESTEFGEPEPGSVRPRVRRLAR